MATRLKKLLAVSWAMPPMPFPRSIQVARALKALSGYGWEITVIHSDPSESGSDADASLSELYDGAYKTIKVSLDSSNPQVADALMSQWYKPALSAVKNELKSNKYSALITFGQPWVDHLIGLEARKYARIPWIVHFSDPWVDSPYYSEVEKSELERWQKLEKNIMRHADLILFTNSQAVDLVMKKYPTKLGRKTQVIPHAYDDDLADTLEHLPILGAPLRLVYTGDFYGPRSVASLFEALKILSQAEPLENLLHVEIVGRIPPAQLALVDEFGLSQFITFQSRLPYVQSLQTLAQADVLLLIDAPSSTPSPFLPSKLVEYLMFRKPIFALTPSQGASADLLRQFECPLVEPDDVPSIAVELGNILRSWQSGNLGISPMFEKMALFYSSRHVGSLLDEAFSVAMDRGTQRTIWPF